MRDREGIGGVTLAARVTLGSHPRSPVTSVHEREGVLKAVACHKSRG